MVAQENIGGVARIILWEGARENEKAQQERWVFVALTTFDLAICSLFTLYGAQAPEREWWQRECISVFEGLAKRHPNMQQELLWFRLPWPYSKHSRLEIALDGLFNSESGGS